MYKSKLILAGALLCSALGVTAQDSYSGDVVAGEGAWCWFADPRALHYKNADGSIDASYLGYIDVHGNVKATQYDFKTGQRNEVLLRSYFQPDDHNNPTFLVLPDERVLVIYSRHTDEKAFYYRVTRRKGDLTSLGEEKKITTSANTTYPSPFILSDDPTHFYLCWRGIGWHPTIAKFTLPDADGNVKQAWGPYQIVQSTGARPYAKYYSNGKDKIYMTYTTGHPDNEDPNWVYFNVININGGGEPSLEDIKGNTLSTKISAGKFSVNKKAEYKSLYPYTVVDAPTGTRDWVWQVVNDDRNRPVIAMVRINSGKTSHIYHYAKWTGSEWRITELADGGGKFHASNTEHCYSGGMAVDPQNVNTVYLSIPTDGTNGKVYEIWKYTVDEQGAVTVREQVTHNSAKNNVRPYVLPGSEGSPLRLGWMNGDYYYWMVRKGYPLGFPTDIRCDYDYVVTISDAAKGAPAWVKDFGGTALTEAQPVEMPAGGAFTLSADINIDATPYGGVMLKGSSLTYGLDAESVKPYVTVAGKKYTSSNRFYTSDAWADNSSGTNGDNWPTKLASFNLTLTYDGKVLNAYRNGLLDQQIKVAGLNASDLRLEPFGGSFGNVSVRKAALTQDEVKYLLHSGALESIELPEVVVTDLVLPAQINGANVAWSSDHPEILRPDGIFESPQAETTVTMTASLQGTERKFTLKAMPRDLDLNLMARYEFETADVYDKDGAKLVRDLSGNSRDLRLMGSAVADGKLNLKANAGTAFSTNGYALLPSDIQKGMRSYTVMMDVCPSSLIGAPRFYDMGCNSGNSMFLRASALAVGVKYAGGTTEMVSGSFKFDIDRSYNVAVTYDADGHMTSIYVDGLLVTAGNNVSNEPYLLDRSGECTRNYLGRTQWWDSSSANDNRDYVGTIDAVRIYNTALTRQEIMALLGLAVDDESLNKDVSDRVTNRDFEGEYDAAPGTGVSADRAIYVPAGWTLRYEKGDKNDMTVIGATDKQNEMFKSVAPAGGEKAFRIRQKWGNSVIGLSQAVDKLPAGYYRAGASVWTSGEGGYVYFNASTESAGTTSAATAATDMWEVAQAMVACNGLEPLTIALGATHAQDGKEQFIGFDNITLTDVTANRNAAELASLLTSMVEGGKALAPTLAAGDVRTALETALAQAEPLTADSDRATLYDAYYALRDALTATDGMSSITDAIITEPADEVIYDLTGRRVTAGNIAPGVYIVNGQKKLVK